MRKSIVKRNGFTLVELLVVVAIIAILSTIGLAVFSNSQRDARDTRRTADINAIASALEANKAVVKYPSSLSASYFSGGTIPKDNSGAASKPHYCAKGGASLVADYAGVWASTTTCPTGWGDADTFDYSGNPYWKVCARIEKGSSDAVNPAPVYCRGNAQ